MTVVRVRCIGRAVTWRNRPLSNAFLGRFRDRRSTGDGHTEADRFGLAAWCSDAQEHVRGCGECVQACTDTFEGPGEGVSVAGGGELEVARLLGKPELVQDLPLAGGGAGMLRKRS